MYILKSNYYIHVHGRSIELVAERDSTKSITNL